MAKVIKMFRERYHGMKRYNVGDEYPESDKERVEQLVKLGYLQEPEQKQNEQEEQERMQEQQGHEQQEQQVEHPGSEGQQELELQEQTQLESSDQKIKNKKRGKKGADTDGDPDA